MKDAVLTIRVPRATREAVEVLAKKEGRSLSQEVERLVEHALGCPLEGSGKPAPRRLANALAGEGAPSLRTFRATRRELSRSAGRRAGSPA